MDPRFLSLWCSELSFASQLSPMLWSLLSMLWLPSQSMSFSNQLPKEGLFGLRGVGLFGARANIMVMAISAANPFYFQKHLFMWVNKEKQTNKYLGIRAQSCCVLKLETLKWTLHLPSHVKSFYPPCFLPSAKAHAWVAPIVPVPPCPAWLPLRIMALPTLCELLLCL